MTARIALAAATIALVTAGCQHTSQTVGSGNATHGGGPVTGGGVPPGGGLVAKGQVTGTLRLVGGPYPGINRTETGHITIHPVSGTPGEAVTAAATGRAGFTVGLPPGRYRLSGNPDGFSAPCNDLHVVVIRPGQTTHANVVCAVP